VPAIHISEKEIEKMVHHSRSESPREACGILAGQKDRDRIRIAKVYGCDNVHPNPNGEFFMKPEDQLRVFLEIEKIKEIEIVGFYHSHPQGPESPSQIDSSKYYWPGYPMAIVSLLPEPSVSFWIWSEDRFHPLEVIRERF
jgi:proteasome lid subunit RPN8/RPN11